VFGYGPDGAGSIALDSTQGTYGTMSMDAQGHWVYTLAGPIADAQGDEQDVFTYTVTDSDGTQRSATITVSIVDDVPTANPDTNTVSEGAVVTGNVLTDGTADVLGADGPVAVNAAVVGVKSGDDTSTPASGNLGGSGIQGLYGKLTLHADGTYTYDGDPDKVPSNGATDYFVYTIKDGDGDLSTTTLTITLSDSGLTATPDNDVTVLEKALDTSATGDLAPSTYTGSDPSDTGETDASNTLVGRVSGGTELYTYALVDGEEVSGGTQLEGLFGVIKLNTGGTYVYTLTKPYTSDDGSAPGTELAKDTFTYRVTDANGNTTTSTITVDIVDDVPRIGPAPNAVLDNEKGLTLTAALPITEGADGAKAPVAVVLSSSSVQDGFWKDASGNFLTSGGKQLLYVQKSDGSLAAVINDEAALTETPHVVFTVTANLATDTYQVSLSSTYALDGAASSTTVNFTDALTGGNADNVLFGASLTQPGALVVWATPESGSSVNYSNQGVGVGGGAVISGSEKLLMSFLNSENWNFPENQQGKALDPVQKTGTNLDYYREFTSVTLTIDHLDAKSGGGQNPPPETMEVEARLYSNDGSSYVTVDINPVETGSDPKTVFFEGTGSGSAAASDDIFTINVVDPADSFNALVFKGAEGEYRVAALTAINRQEGTDHTVQVSATVEDGDGDVSTAAAWSVTFEATDDLVGGGSADVLAGGLGNDNLSGLGGNDILIGGKGDDVLTGGAGDDVFMWQAGDGLFIPGEGNDPDSSAADRVTDFNDGLNKLDLTELLVDEAHSGTSPGNLGAYLDFVYDSSTNSTTISIKSLGAAPGSVVDQVIVLQGVDLTAGNTLSESQIITNLLEQSKLIAG